MNKTIFGWKSEYTDDFKDTHKHLPIRCYPHERLIGEGLGNTRNKLTCWKGDLVK